LARYDYFDPDTDVGENENQRTIVGVAWDMGHHNTFLLDYDRVTYEGGGPDDDRLQLTLQISF
jgi:hypothetical protein